MTLWALYLDGEYPGEERRGFPFAQALNSDILKLIAEACTPIAHDNYGKVWWDTQDTDDGGLYGHVKQQPFEESGIDLCGWLIQPPDYYSAKHFADEPRADLKRPHLLRRAIE